MHLQVLLSAAILLASSKNNTEPPIARWNETHLEKEKLENFAPKTHRERAEAHQALHGEHHGGDMILPEDLTNEVINATKHRWPADTDQTEVPYVIDPSLQLYQSLILEAMEQYNKLTCVKFVSRTNQKDYIKLYKDNGCFADFGYQGGVQRVSLGVGCHYIGTVVHELGHSIGLLHEHQRSDRDTYVTVYEENVAEGKLHNLHKVVEDGEVKSTFNYNSIMMNGYYAFSRLPGKLKTIVPKSGQATILEPYEKHGLENSDVEQIRKIYQCG